MKFFMIISCVFILLFMSNILHAQSPADADTAARDAVKRLEAALGGNTSGKSSAENKPDAQLTQGGSQPRWVDDPYAAYPRGKYLAAVGSASNRADAEKKALAALIAIFGQSIRSDNSTVTTYSEAVQRGVVNVTENTRIRDEITAAASMDKLIGAEIGNVWDSGRGAVYAAAYMERDKTISVYTDLLIINNRNIELLTKMTAIEKNTFDGYARYKLAANIAGINAKYAEVVSQAGGSTASLNLMNADFYNLEAANIIKNITVAVIVNDDHSNGIRDAFAKVLSAEGIRTGGNNPLYTLEVKLNSGEVIFPGNSRVFCRLELSANLIEKATGASLFPFNFSEREGHNTFANAETAALRSAEKTIAEKYPVLLREYLASLTPKK